MKAPIWGFDYAAWDSSLDNPKYLNVWKISNQWLKQNYF